MIFDLQRFGTRGIKISYDIGIKKADEVLKLIKDAFSDVVEVTIAGSLRRRKNIIGDIDLIIVNSNGSSYSSFNDFLLSSCKFSKILSSGHRIINALDSDNVQYDFYFCKESEYVCMLNYLTGSQKHNISMRATAKKLGYKLNQYNLFDKDGNIIKLNTEEDLYSVLSKEYREPQYRD